MKTSLFLLLLFLIVVVVAKQFIVVVLIDQQDLSLDLWFLRTVLPYQRTNILPYHCFLFQFSLSLFKSSIRWVLLLPSPKIPSNFLLISSCSRQFLLRIDLFSFNLLRSLSCVILSVPFTLSILLQQYMSELSSYFFSIFLVSMFLIHTEPGHPNMYSCLLYTSRCV